MTRLTNIAPVFLALLLAAASPCLAGDNTTGGTAAGGNLSTGTSNTIIGAQAGAAVTTGTDNTLLGYKSGFGVTGSSNIILGEDPSSAITSGSSNILIGNSLTGVTAATSNQIDIGDVIVVTGSGTPSTSTTTVKGNLTVNGSCVGCGGGGGGGGSGFVNKFRNGTMLVSQRMAANTSKTLSTAADAYWIDGWEYHITGANVTGYWQQSPFTASSGNNPPYLPGYMEIKGAASNTGIDVYQKIESFDATALAGQVVTVQFQFYNNSGASITPTFQTCYASATDNFGTCTADVGATNMQACSNGSTCTEAYTFTASSNATNGYEVQFNFGAMTSNSDIIEMSGFDIRATPGVSTGLNSAPSTIELPTVAAELARNQRYFVAWGDIGEDIGSGVATSTTSIRININLPVQMRVSPTAALGTPGDLEISTYAGTNTVAPSSLVGLTATGRRAVLADFGTAGSLTTGTAYNLYIITPSAGNLTFTSEL
jgi:hypothetical protein